MMYVYIVCGQNQARMSSYAWQGASVSTSVSQSVSQSVSINFLLNRKVLNAVETCWKNLELTFWGLAVSNQCCQAVMKGN